MKFNYKKNFKRFLFIDIIFYIINMILYLIFIIESNYDLEQLQYSEQIQKSETKKLEKSQSKNKREKIRKYLQIFDKYITKDEYESDENLDLNTVYDNKNILDQNWDNFCTINSKFKFPICSGLFSIMQFIELICLRKQKKCIKLFNKFDTYQDKSKSIINQCMIYISNFIFQKTKRRYYYYRDILYNALNLIVDNKEELCLNADEKKIILDGNIFLLIIEKIKSYQKQNQNKEEDLSTKNIINVLLFSLEYHYGFCLQYEHINALKEIIMVRPLIWLILLLIYFIAKILIVLIDLFCIQITISFPYLMRGISFPYSIRGMFVI